MDFACPFLSSRRQTSGFFLKRYFVDIVLEEERVSRNYCYLGRFIPEGVVCIKCGSMWGGTYTRIQSPDHQLGTVLQCPSQMRGLDLFAPH
jgi:hypothetical protein